MTEKKQDPTARLAMPFGRGRGRGDTLPLPPSPLSQRLSVGADTADGIRRISAEHLRGLSLSSIARTMLEMLVAGKIDPSAVAAHAEEIREKLST